MLHILFSNTGLCNSNVLGGVRYWIDLPQEVKVNGGELRLNQGPETPEEMRSLNREENCMKDLHILAVSK